MKFLKLLALSASVLSIPAMAADTPATVTIETGALRGVVADGVASWKGIPFAAAPVGALRWRAPQPAPAWKGVRDAAAYGHDCMQVPFPSDAAPLGTPPAEDCLMPTSGARRRLGQNSRDRVDLWRGFREWRGLAADLFGGQSGP
jgi:para-nitrobenzyl esterase